MAMIKKNYKLYKKSKVRRIIITIVTPHAQCKRGKVIGVGVYVCGPNGTSDQLTFSNISSNL